jgi:uncharacterized membrane protein
MDQMFIYLLIFFVSTLIGAIIASVALMRYLTRIGALDFDAINNHRAEVRKHAEERLKRKHK